MASGLAGVQLERCRRVLSHPSAPKTADSWRSLAEMMDLGIGSIGENRAGLAVVKRRPGKAKG
jgi:hypothetical protein